ncbi:MAG: PDZ domain-containing protein, partial [Phycisphaerales bacterium]
TGKRAVFGARGDIWTVPAKKGHPRNLTLTDGVAERDPTWSPDGQWIAYFSDATGEYQVYITQSDGRGETKKITDQEASFLFGPNWSPDSKHLTFTDKSGALYLHTLDSGETKLIDTDPYARPLRVSWSHDSRWLAYVRSLDNGLLAVWLYNRESGESHQVTSGRFLDSWPTFDRKGDYLFLASQRNFTSPIHEDVGSTFVYAGTDQLLVVPLRSEVGSPFAPKSDEETWGEDNKRDEATDDEGEKDAGPGDKAADGDNDSDEAEDANDESEKKDEEKEDEDKPLEIELEGFEQRAILLPVKSGAFTNLAFNHEGKLLYVRHPRPGSDDKPSIKIYDLKEDEKQDKREEKTVLDGVGQFSISADGKKLLVRKDETFAVVNAEADQKMDQPMSVSGLVTTIDPRAEWRQMFVEAWRLQRDFFYDPNMHGVDWEAVRRRYEPMLEHCASRRDVSFVIGEMIAELNVGHAYLWSAGDTEKGPEVSVGMLGADFELRDGAYRIARIIQGAPWDVDARGPLSRPGLEVKEGDYLLAVNGVPLDVTHDPWAAFQGLADKTITITVSDKPTLDDEARQVVVETTGSEVSLRYRDWVERNRTYVEDKTDGRVGYIHVPDTADNGQNELFRQFYGQIDKQALIIDERWNSGGHSPSRFVELLNRPIASYWTSRHGKDSPSPRDAHYGPKCMLINGAAGSGGDSFPYLFRQAGVGKLIGTRTWGGLVGISGNPGLIDGGAITVPTVAFYETNGTWGVEGHGVEPDIEVIDDPALMTDGGDPQLDAAIEHMLDEIERHPYRPPGRPAYPDRSGMGVAPQDR